MEEQLNVLENRLNSVEQSIEESIENEQTINRRNIHNRLNDISYELNYLEDNNENLDFHRVNELRNRLNNISLRYPLTVNFAEMFDEDNEEDEDAQSFITIEEYTDEENDEEDEIDNRNLQRDLAKMLILERIKREIKNRSDNYNFETLEIDESKLPENCYDVILLDTYNVNQYLESDIDSIMFINIGQDNRFDVLCYLKSYLQESIANFKNNWFYECNGPFKRIRGVSTNDRQIFGYNPDGSISELIEPEIYLVLPLERGTNVLVPIYKVQKILEENNKNRIYYISPELDEEGNIKTITHTISYGALRFMDEEEALLGAKHCQEGSNMNVYDIKICGGDKCVIGGQFV